MEALSKQENRPPRGARRALLLLLGINLFNYIDRFILVAVEPQIRAELFQPGDPHAMAKTGSLATAFLVTYMLAAPLFGWLADRTSRWLLIAISVSLWSLASAASGLASTFALLLGTRVFVGIGEAGYGPAAPTILADYYPKEIRGRILSFFYMAIPVGSALGYVIGGFIGTRWGWRTPFYCVAAPGLLLGALALCMDEPARGSADGGAARRASLADYARLFRTPSFVLNTAAMAAMTFAIGGLSFWVPSYIFEYRHQPDLGRINLIFGGITVVAGLCATISGGMVGDKLRSRFPGSYFLVSGLAMLIAFPLSIAMLFVPFPLAWVFIFLAVFFLFFNTGPSNTALANVTPASIRASAFALNIFVIHAAGDAISPPLIGALAEKFQMNIAFLAVSVAMLVAGVLWLCAVRFLERDSRAAAEIDRSGTAS